MGSETKVIPYVKAVKIMKDHPYTGGSYAIAKMILSLYNDEYCYSFRECVDGRDLELKQVCLDMACYYAGHGEDQHLRDAGEATWKMYPRLIEIGEAGHMAKAKERNKE